MIDVAEGGSRALARSAAAGAQSAVPGVHRLWRANHLAFALAVLAAPVVFRALPIWEQGIRVRAGDLQGFYTDFCVSTLFVVLAVLVGAVTRAGMYALVLGWCVLHYANYENVRALGAMIQIENAFHLRDGTFLGGSALAISRPWLLAALLATALAASWWALKFRRLDRQVWKLFAAAALVLAAGPAVCKPRDVAQWRQSHFAVDNARAMVRLHGAQASSTDAAYREPPELTSRLDEMFRPDLSGKPRVELGHGRRNVLLVVLEGISGAHIESIRKRHGVECDVQMPKLSRLCEENLTWSQFVAHNRQTNRGLWAILSGTYDGMTVASTARMTDYQGAGERRLLPHVLRDSGYQTVFLEAAPLSFMQKDQFMPRAGFEQVMGDEVFADEGRCRLRTKWGPDDRSFFDRAAETVESLRQTERPWFLALLTAGTHHPFALPEEYEGPGEKGSFARAAAYADLAIGEFIERLRQSGSLENTLVLITSDESAGIQQGEDELLLNLSQNWGFLTAIFPEGERANVSETFVQSDLGLSILDYLGLADRAPHFGGRSVFRSYDSRRPVLIANHYFRQIGLFDTDDVLTLCSDDWETRRRYKVQSAHLFGGHREARECDLAALEFIRAMAHRTDSASAANVVKRYELAAQREYDLRGECGRRLLFGGQFISLKPRTVVKVEIDAEVVAEAGTLVDLEHELVPLRMFASTGNEASCAIVEQPHARSDEVKAYVSRRAPCFAGGGRFRLSYCYDNASDDWVLFCNLAATKRTRGNCTIRVNRATLEMIPREMWDGPALPGDAVQVSVEKYDDSSWRNLAALCKGGRLVLSGAHLNERWLEEVAKLEGVEELVLDGSNIGDEDLTHLAPLQALRKASLDDTQVTDLGLERLRSLPNLREVSARNTRASQEGIRQLSSFGSKKPRQQF